MSDAIDRHIDHVRELTHRDGSLDPRGPSASIRNPAWFLPDGTPTSARRRLHASIRRELRFRAGDEAERSRHAYVLAGPPGSGKSTLCAGVLAPEIAGYVQIDPDEIKALLVRSAVQDDSFESFLKPQAVKDLEASGERFYPLELSGLLHVEAVGIGDVLRAELLREDVPVVVDGVLSNVDSAVALGRQFEEAGYTIDVVVADSSFEVAEARIRRRWREAYERTLDGSGDLMGGRWVPSDYARFVFDGPDGRSRPAVSAESLAREVGSVERLRMFRADAVEAEPRLTSVLVRTHRDASLVDTASAHARRPDAGAGEPRRRSEE